MGCARVAATPAFLLALHLCVAPAGADSREAVRHLRVGVFAGQGASAGSVQNAVEALRVDPGISPRLLSAAEILGGALDDLDAIVFPGGSGSAQTGNLGDLGVSRVRAFVLEQGRGAVGICAGAYLLSDTPDYPCLRLCGVAAVDREHDERGHGVVAFRPTEPGLAVFPELAGSPTRYVYYYEGPLLVPAVSGAPFEVLGTFASDVHLEHDAPAGIMPEKPMLVRAEAGNGRVFLSAGHPEATPGLRWMVPRMVRWACRSQEVAYSRAVVRPAAEEREILFDDPLRAEEGDLLLQLLYAGPEDRVRAIHRLVEMRSWDGPRGIVGCLRSAHPQVRQAAAKGLAEMEATGALADLEGVREVDATPLVRATLDSAITRLRLMTPAVERASPARAPREVAVTFDDLPAVSVPGPTRQGWTEMTDRLVAAIVRHQVPAVGFVNGDKLVGADGAEEGWRVDLLRSWVGAGVELGNHTFSHQDLHRVGLSAFLADVRQGDAAIRPLLAEVGQAPRFFRHPCLHTGRDEATRQAVDTLLGELGLRPAPVTFDHSEWVFARAYSRTLERGDVAAAEQVRAAYLPYMEGRVEYFERQSNALFGREVRQVLLLHANALNADTFDQLVAMLEGRGYAFTTLEHALADDAYALPDGYLGPAGISWLHRWCYALGGRHLVLPDEPRCPDWVMRLAGVDSE